MALQVRLFLAVFKRKNVLLTCLFVTLVLMNYFMFVVRKTKAVEYQEAMIDLDKPVEVRRPLAVVAPLPEYTSSTRNLEDNLTSQVDLDEVYRQRRNTVKSICKKLNIQPRSIGVWSSQVWKMKDLDIAFCPVPQSSNTWKETMEIWIRSQEKTRSSFVLDENRYRTHKKQFPVQRGNPKFNETFNKLLSSSLKVIFTRNPYSQIFSYYVDNILVPSKETLELNKRILARSQTLASDAELACGHNVSFAQFCHYLMYSSLKRDLVGNLRHCDVCGLEYDVIGKENTLDQDILYVYNKIKSEGKFSSLEDFAKEIDFSQIVGYVRTAFSRKTKITCLSAYTMYRRLWRQLQIWGFIGKKLSFPYDKDESKTLKYDKLLDAVLKAYHSSEPMSRSNRNEAMTQAYQEISDRVLSNLRDTYMENFFLFGYEDRPALLFFKQGPRYEFQYFDVISLYG